MNPLTAARSNRRTDDNDHRTDDNEPEYADDRSSKTRATGGDAVDADAGGVAAVLDGAAGPFVANAGARGPDARAHAAGDAKAPGPAGRAAGNPRIPAGSLERIRHRGARPGPGQAARAA